MADLSQLVAQVRRRGEFAVSDSSARLQQFLRETSPRVTGNMQNKTTVTARGLTAEARAATEYASFVREGTREYKIPAVKRKRGQKMLRFYWPGPKGPGEWMVLPQVTHPKTTGNTWWDKGLAKWQDFLRDALRRAPN